MIKIISVLLTACFVLVACQKSGPAAIVDKDAAMNAVNYLFDAYGNATRSKNADSIASLLTEDLLFLGTDPGEFWNKQQVTEEFKKMAQDSTISWDYTVDKREVRLSDDGTMAVAVEQFPGFVFVNKKISLRTVFHARMMNGQWKIDFCSWSLIPKNEDLEKLNKAMGD